VFALKKVSDWSLRTYIKSPAEWKKVRGKGKMVEQILSIIILISLPITIFFHVKSRKKAGVKGWKPSLTSICFFSIAIVNLIGYWFHLLGIISWAMTMILLFMGAYFSKYLKPVESN